MEEAEHDVLAYLSFPVWHRTKLHSTDPIERLNKEVKRRADVVGFGHSSEPTALMPSLPDAASIKHSSGALAIVCGPMADRWLALDQNDEGQT